MKMMNDTISHAFIPGRLAKQKVVQAELEEKLSKSEENLDIAQTKSNVSRSFHRKRSQVESIGVKHHNLVKHEPCLDIKAKPLPFVRNLLGVQKVSIKVTQLTLLLKRKKLHPHPPHTQPLWQTLNLPLFQDLRSKNRKAMEALSEMEQKYVKLLKTQQA